MVPFKNGLNCYGKSLRMQRTLPFGNAGFVGSYQQIFLEKKQGWPILTQVFRWKGDLAYVHRDFQLIVTNGDNLIIFVVAKKNTTKTELDSC